LDIPQLVFISHALYYYNITIDFTYKREVYKILTFILSFTRLKLVWVKKCAGIPIGQQETVRL